MTKRLRSQAPALCRIRLKGRLDDKWSDWFDQMIISHAGDETVMTGEVPDQAALHGLLIRIRDLNLSLVSVQCKEGNTKNDE